jgi:hypothetical protein
MSEQGAVQFMTTLQTNFRQKRHESEQHEERWVALMVAELKGFSDEVLEQAAKDMLRRRRGEYFPILSECLAACQDAKHWIDQAKPRLRLNAAQDAAPSSTEREKLANELIMGEMGREAANSNWVLSLWNFIRDNGRLPAPHEVATVKREALGIEIGLEMAREMANAPKRKAAGRVEGLQQLDEAKAGAAWQIVGFNMLAKRERLVDMVLHGVMK